MDRALRRPAPSYHGFARLRTRRYDVYASADVQAALFRAASIDALGYAATAEEPHLETRLVSATHYLAEAARTEAPSSSRRRLIAWYRRPRRYARELPMFPFAEGATLVFFASATREPALICELVDYYAESADAATGYLTLELVEARATLAATLADVERALGGK